MSPTRTVTLICAAVVLLFASGCSSEPDQPTVVASITLQNLQTQPIQTGTDKQALNNCGGTDVAKYIIDREREVSNLLQVDGEFSVTADGSVKVFGTGIGLGAAVASKVGATYGERNTVKRALELTVKPKTMVQYEVSLQDVYQVGEADITVGNQRTKIPFHFFNDFALALLTTRELPCSDTPTIVPTFTVASADGITPEEQPITPTVPTATPIPPTATPIPPTATPIPPTATSTPTEVPLPPDTLTPSTAPLPSVDGCGTALGAGETRTIEAGTFIVGDVVIDGTRQHDYKVREGTVAYFERPASVFAEWGAACYRGGADLMPEMVAREFSEGCQPDDGCTKVRVVYVRADGTQDATCQYPDNSTQPVQRTDTDSWCP